MVAARLSNETFVLFSKKFLHVSWRRLDQYTTYSAHVIHNQMRLVDATTNGASAPLVGLALPNTNCASYFVSLTRLQRARRHEKQPGLETVKIE